MSKPKTERNKKIVELRDDLEKRLTFRALAAMFQTSERNIRKIYHREKAKSKK